GHLMASTSEVVLDPTGTGTGDDRRARTLGPVRTDQPAAAAVASVARSPRRCRPVTLKVRYSPTLRWWADWRDRRSNRRCRTFRRRRRWQYLRSMCPGPGAVWSRTDCRP